MDRSLRAFVAIAEERNLTAAARRVGLAQPSLSKKLRLIEHEYGGRLFRRLPRGMQLTPLGECLYEHAKRIERDYAYAREEMKALIAGHLPVMRVGAGPIFHLLHIARIFEQLRAEFPDTQLILEAGTNIVTLPRLIRGELDAVVGQIEAVENGENIVITKVATFEHCVVMSREDAAREVSEPTALDLVGYTWITYGTTSEADSTLTEYFRASGLRPPKLAVCMSSFTTALQLIVTGGHYAMIAPTPLRAMIEAAGAATCRVNIPLDRFDTGVYMRRSSRRYPIVRRFAEVTVRMFEDAWHNQAARLPGHEGNHAAGPGIARGYQSGPE